MAKKPTRRESANQCWLPHCRFGSWWEGEKKRSISGGWTRELSQRDDGCRQRNVGRSEAGASFMETHTHAEFLCVSELWINSLIAEEWNISYAHFPEMTGNTQGEFFWFMVKLRLTSDSHSSVFAPSVALRFEFSYRPATASSVGGNVSLDIKFA